VDFQTLIEQREQAFCTLLESENNNSEHVEKGPNYNNCMFGTVQMSCT